MPKDRVIKERMPRSRQKRKAGAGAKLVDQSAIEPKATTGTEAKAIEPKATTSTEVRDRSAIGTTEAKKANVQGPERQGSSKNESPEILKVIRRNAIAPVLTPSTSDERTAKIKLCISLYALELGEMSDEVLRYALDQHLVRQAARARL